MLDLRDNLLPRLRSRRLPGLELPPGFVLPAYDGLSLANLPASICAWLEAAPFGAPPLDAAILDALSARYRHVILVLADGLGLNLLENTLNKPHGPFRHLLKRALLAPLTSIVPSTTVAALTTLFTGQPVMQHAMTGYEMWLKEYGMSINAITHSPFVFTGDPGGLRRAGFDTTTFLDVPTLGPHLSARGVRAFAYHHASIFRSSLSTMLLPGMKSIPYRTLSDLWATLGDVLHANAAQRSYHYVYWGDLDELMHRYGPTDLRAANELEHFATGLTRFTEQSMPPQTLLLLLADHGQVRTPLIPHYDLGNHPQITRRLTILPSGEQRFAYLFPREGSSEEIRAYFEHTWPGKFTLIPTALAIQSGLMGNGPAHPALPDRMGDWIAVPLESEGYLWWGSLENRLLGRHGGLSAEEMLVPLLALEL